MSSMTVIGYIPDRRPINLAEFRNAHGWAPSIWGRLLAANGRRTTPYLFDDPAMRSLWQSIEEQPEWQQIPNVLTFDTGIVPFQEFGRAADMLDEFNERCPSPQGHVNHVPAVAELLRTRPEVPFVGVYGTSVSDNPFDPWDEVNDREGSGIPLSACYVLERHRHWLATRPERKAKR